MPEPWVILSVDKADLDDLTKSRFTVQTLVAQALEDESRRDAALCRAVVERCFESRDYVDILGEKPGRIVAVWLIAVSIFQHGEGRAAFGPIHIDAGGWQQDFV